MHRFLLRENLRLFRARLTARLEVRERSRLHRQIVETEAELVEVEAHSTADAYRDNLPLVTLALQRLDMAITMSGAQFGTVRLHDERTDRLNLLAQINLPLLFLVHFVAIRRGDASVCSLCLEGQTHAHNGDVESDPHYAPHMPIARVTGYRAVEVASILRPGGTFLGTLSLLYAEPRAFDAADDRRMDTLTRSIGSCIGSILNGAQAASLGR